MPGLDYSLEPPGEVRRFEVINAALDRRRWTADDRARIIAKTLEPSAVVSEVARRHGLTPQQLFTWRREVRKRTEDDSLAFVPSVVEPEPAPDAEDPYHRPICAHSRIPIDVITFGRADTLFQSSQAASRMSA